MSWEETVSGQESLVQGAGPHIHTDIGNFPLWTIPSYVNQRGGSSSPGHAKIPTKLLERKIPVVTTLMGSGMGIEVGLLQKKRMVLGDNSLKGQDKMIVFRIRIVGHASFSPIGAL
jgi:hypothetical protein